MASDLPQLMSGLALEASPLLRLPRELRDDISDLLAISERRLNLRIVMKKGEKPQKIIFTTGDCGRASSQLRKEYTEALQRRLELLMRTSDLAGNQLNSPGAQLELVSARLHVSQTKHSDGSIAQNVLRLTIPITFSTWVRVQWAQGGQDLMAEPAVVVHFATEDSEVLETRARIKGSFRYDGHEFLLVWPTSAAPALEQLVSTSKATDWRGSTGFYALWQNYVVRYTSKKILRE